MRQPCVDRQQYRNTSRCRNRRRMHRGRRISSEGDTAAALGGSRLPGTRGTRPDMTCDLQ